MSLLHRNLIAASFAEMLKKFEPIAIETAEAIVGIVAPAAAPAIDAGIEIAQATLGATNSDHIAAGVAAASAPPAAPAPAAPAAPAALPASPAVPSVKQTVNQATNQAALAAVDALALQMSQLATQLAAIRSNLVPQ